MKSPILAGAGKTTLDRKLRDSGANHGQDRVLSLSSEGQTNELMGPARDCRAPVLGEPILPRPGCNGLTTRWPTVLKTARAASTALGPNFGGIRVMRIRLNQTACHKGAMRPEVGVMRQSQLPQVVRALRTAGGLAPGMNRRQQQGDENADDRDNDQDSDQRESGRTTFAT